MILQKEVLVGDVDKELVSEIRELIELRSPEIITRNTSIRVFYTTPSKYSSVIDMIFKKSRNFATSGIYDELHPCLYFPFPDCDNLIFVLDGFPDSYDAIEGTIVHEIAHVEETPKPVIMKTGKMGYFLAAVELTLGEFKAEKKALSAAPHSLCASYYHSYDVLDKRPVTRVSRLDPMYFMTIGTICAWYNSEYPYKCSLLPAFKRLKNRYDKRVEKELPNKDYKIYKNASTKLLSSRPHSASEIFNTILESIPL